MMNVKNFWMRPSKVPLNAKEFTFGYMDEKGKKKQYQVEVKDKDLESFHAFTFALMAAKRKNQLPWPFVSKLKDKVKITTPDDEAVQMEMNLKANKIARRFSDLRNSRYIREEGKGKPGERGFRPTLWYWITPDGKKKLVDQKTVTES